MSTAGESPSCFIIGEGTLVVPCAQALLERGMRIHGLVTREPSLQKWAEEQSIPHVPPGEKVLSFLSSAPFDYLFSIVNLSMVKEEVLRLPRKMAINFHDGPLPRYAGLYCTSWALLNREPQHGVTWHEMTAEADKGRILKQRIFDLAPGETAFSLNARCYTTGMETFTELAEELVTGRVQPVEQDFSVRSYFGMAQRPEAAAVIDVHGDAEVARALVAALDYAGYPNPLAFAKLWLGSAPVGISEAKRLEDSSGSAPGTVVSIEGDALTVALEGGDLTLKGPKGLCGAPLTWAELLGSRNIAVGDALPRATPELRARLTEVGTVAGKAEAFFLRRLENLMPPDLPFLGGGSKEEGTHTLTLSASELSPAWAAELPAEERMLFTAAAFLSRLSPEPRFDVGFSDAGTRARIQGVEGFFASQLPLRVELPMKETSVQAAATFRKALTQVREKGAMARDVLGRSPQLANLQRHLGEVSYPVALRVAGAGETAHAVPGAVLTIAIEADAGKAQFIFDAARVDSAKVAELSRQLAAFLASVRESPHKPVVEQDLLGAEERKLLGLWNDTQRVFPQDATVHSLFRAQAKRAPDATALICRGKTLTYRELDERSDVLAGHLRAEGVGRDVRVGIFMERSLEMMVAVLATHKAGGCYVPLDPAYPAERVAFMVEDSSCHLVLTQERLMARVPPAARKALAVDGEWAKAPAAQNVQPTPPGDAQSLAYVIYTSGSTGKPKGVMIEHRNVVNFGVGMDERLGAEPGTWLAVTSLNFDISVLELLWTLTRGFTVVIHSEKLANLQEGQHASRAMDFSLFYFSSDEGERPEGRYDLLMESARFADTNGFCAVWTPERHFHAFGGLFPNPAVTSAALAVATKKVQLRAGSLVSPLHPTLRIAEDWSVVDNISHGRVGISFAAGWQPNDFALRPENFPDRKKVMFQQIEDVRRLWRGEALEVKGGNGNMVKVKTMPRPLQKELPIWVTTAGNPETFEEAGRNGCHLLTHLLGQTMDEVAQKIAVYRAAWTKAGHPGKGIVSLMLHTFVGESDASVKETVRGPMKGYLKSSVSLIKEAAWSFPAFKEQTTLSNGNFSTDNLSAEEMDALLDFSFERYYQTSGLFGTVDGCVAIVDRCKGMDVDEVACLVDFGVPTELVMKHLPMLAEVRRRANLSVGVKAEPEPDMDLSVPGLLERYPVTHLQCTPSQANMLLAEERARGGLKRLKKMMVGGEAFPIPLARQLSELVGGDVVNMYGPTETTIWSSTQVVKNVGDTVPIGKPIANTQLYVLDAQQRPMPIGAAGELYIGGAGVVRGYHQRPELNRERFVADPFSTEPGARMYRTGDAARWRQDGVVEFIGRLDHQVKVRGYRIELGEIETRLGEHPAVRETVVIVREDVPGDKRLVAYLIARPGQHPETDALREFLRSRLPEYMMPSAFVVMSAFPQTPNKKVDRKALPAPEAAVSRAAFTNPESETETLIAGIWQEVLKLEKVGVEDKFADLGGHSLLMVQVLDKLKAKVDKPLTLVDLFRYPTIRALSGFLSGDSGQDEALQETAARGEARAAARKALQNRRRR